MEEKNILVANPSKSHSILYTLIFAICESLGFLAYLYLRIENPETVGDKVFQSILVCALLLLSLFMIFGIICNLRSLYPRAVLTVTDEKIILEKKREILISELEEVKQNGKFLLIKDKNENVITLRKGDVNIPLETLEYAIKQRTKQDVSSYNI